MPYDFSFRVDPGRIRHNNEDAVLVDPARGLAVLADGMGGYNAGEVASRIAVAMISTEMRRQLAMPGAALDIAGGERLLAEQALRANRAIFEAAQRRPQYAGMGTTLVGALWHDGHVIVVHVGDSRLYRLRGPVLAQLTRDHSVLQEQIDRGLITPDQARDGRNRNLVTRAVGVEPDLVPEVHSHRVEVGDLYLLCSDGLNDMVSDEQIGQMLRACEDDLTVAARELVQRANDHGGRDNVSVILVRVRAPCAARPGLARRLKSWRW